MSDKNVNHPEHYMALPVDCAHCGQRVEAIQVTECMTFNRGNAVKYLWRAGRKGSDWRGIEDLKKARWYVDREIKRLEAVDPDNG